MNRKNVFAFFFSTFKLKGKILHCIPFYERKILYNALLLFHLASFRNTEYSAINSFIISDQLCKENTIILLYNIVKFNKLKSMKEINSGEKTISFYFIFYVFRGSYLQLYLIDHFRQFRCYHGF